MEEKLHRCVSYSCSLSLSNPSYRFVFEIDIFSPPLGVLNWWCIGQRDFVCHSEERQMCQNFDSAGDCRWLLVIHILNGCSISVSSAEGRMRT